jgi:hypothetical protein
MENGKYLLSKSYGVICPVVPWVEYSVLCLAHHARPDTPLSYHKDFPAYHNGGQGCLGWVRVKSEVISSLEFSLKIQ